MPYFKGSTANPTGFRPWTYAMQGSGSGSNGLGGLGRVGRLRFYNNANYPLPQASNGPLMLTAGVPGGQQLSRTLGDFLPRLPEIGNSPYTGKADYGDPLPAYSPLNPAYFKMRLGASFIDNGMPSRIPLSRGGPVYLNTPLPGSTQVVSPSAPVVSGAGTPVAITSPVSTLMPVPGQAQLPPGFSSWAQYYAWQAQQQGTASSSAAAPSSQTAVTTNPAMFTSDSAGDIINATGGAIFLTAAQANALGVTAASLNAGGPAAAAAALTAANNLATSGTAAATTAPSWFTDPNQALITGLPNWGLLAIGGGLLYLFKKK
jgi:hypothetical protein